MKTLTAPLGRIKCVWLDSHQARSRELSQRTAPAASRRNTLPGSAPVWTASSTTTTPLTSTVVRDPLG